MYFILFLPSRAARTKLAKSGVIDDATDVVAPALQKLSDIPPLEVEFQDERKLNVVSFAFAAYTFISHEHIWDKETPRKIFFTFHFFACQPTR